MHSHQSCPDSQVCLRCFDYNEDIKLKPNELAMVGIHPWAIDSNFSKSAYTQLLDSYHQYDCIGLGEFGLDKVRGENYSKQIIVASQLVKLAIDHSIPRISLHCVRAHDDLFRLIKQSRYMGKILLHDYNGNIEQTKLWLKLDSYFSFSPRIFNLHQKGLKVLTWLEGERCLLESDDQLVDMIEFYRKVGQLVDVSVINQSANDFLS